MKKILFFILLTTSFNAFSQSPPNAFPVKDTICDKDGIDDGQTLIDLTIYEQQVLGDPSVPLSNYTFEYFSDSALKISVLNPKSTTTNPAWVKITDKSTNLSNNSEITITLIALPVINQLTVPPICIDSKSGIVTDSNIISGYNETLYTFDWKDNSGATVANSSNYSTNVPGNYTVNINAVSITGCDSGTIPFTVIESAAPAVVSYTTSGYFSEQHSITINATPYIGDGSNFLYSLDGKTPQTTNSFTNVKPGPHEIAVTDKNGCGSAISLPVSVMLVYNQKFFSPNGDGINDKFMIKGLENQTDSIIYIFDRHGRLIVQLFANDEGWDGTLNGQIMPADDYWFTICYNEDGVSKEYKSNFSLKR